MRLTIASLRYPADQEVDLVDMVCTHINLNHDKIKDIRIIRKSLDARKKEIFWVVSLEITAEGISRAEVKNILSCRGVSLSLHWPTCTTAQPVRKGGGKVVIAGCGPAGVFAALTLIKRGVKPVILERGSEVEKRVSDVEKFWKDGLLNEESNVQFGEGGAGTFSDGKLTTRIKDERKNQVLQALVEAGAPEEITYLNRPHLGSDQLISIVKGLRERILQSGVEIRFNTRLIDLIVEKGRLRGIETSDGMMDAENLFLAIGHSSRDTYEMLHKRGIAMTPKAFAVGLRIEHPQKYINLSQYGTRAFHPRLGSADYFLTYKDKKSERGVYTFCMCPGGCVIAGSSEKETVTTNGMSNSLRSSPFGNSAVVVTVGAGDFGSDHPLAGVYFQRELERKAYTLGGGRYCAPAQRASDFLQGVAGGGIIQCTYRPGIKNCNLQEIVPSFILEPLKRGLLHFEKKMKGFIQEGVLISLETRTSSPVRLIREEKNYHSVNLPGLIPVGEGSGYSGGIVSSAVDGIRSAERFDID
ncbi:MAG: hypothetical protein NT096_13495 [Proteobacteria bacterium]|nr:hypothetical protein [Pseudomonadota bacterium]